MYPSCSTYSYEAIKKFGCFKGVYVSLKRLLKCNPSEHGYDPLEGENK
jgi:putative component of membrane protein insertase Oxa1/YidC/SpoIIIJ protein YidD